MISVEHMDELITRFNSGELDIRDIIEQSYFGGEVDTIETFEKLLKSFDENFYNKFFEFLEDFHEYIKSDNCEDIN